VIGRVCWFVSSFVTFVVISRKVEVYFSWNLHRSLAFKKSRSKFKVKTTAQKIYS